MTERQERDFFMGYESTPEMRKEILEKVAELWEKHPSERFGQLLENHVFGHHLMQESGECIFHIYDETILANLKEALK
jgi:acyl-CoA reductase-like NAD-dependent aldehyde dehydrogenase